MAATAERRILGAAAEYAVAVEQWRGRWITRAQMRESFHHLRAVIRDAGDFSVIAGSTDEENAVLGAAKAWVTLPCSVSEDNLHQAVVWRAREGR